MNTLMYHVTNLEFKRVDFQLLKMYNKDNGS